MTRLHEFGRGVIAGERRGAAAALLRGAAALAAPLYGLAVRGRNALYDRGLLRARDLARPAISVGNLTTGGTGKTPVVRWLVERLRERGHRPAVLIRGYRAAAGVSDEAELLRAALTAPGQRDPVIVDADRLAGARRALQADPAIDLFVLDDGFQHRRARRALDLVLIDATAPWDAARLLPRGMLREPKSSLARADAIVLTRCDLADEAALRHLEAEAARRAPGAPVVRCRHAIGAVRQPDGSPAEALPDRRVVAFSGIGNPAAFEALLTRGGATLVEARRFADHHAYTPGDVDALRRLARGLDATLITTAKDAVRLAAVDPRLLGIDIAELTLDFVDGGGARLIDLIEQRAFGAAPP